jgi:hypothetical protein
MPYLGPASLKRFGGLALTERLALQVTHGVAPRENLMLPTYTNPATFA